jgi:hypothetical protein
MKYKNIVPQPEYIVDCMVGQTIRRFENNPRTKRHPLLRLAGTNPALQRLPICFAY